MLTFVSKKNSQKINKNKIMSKTNVLLGVLAGVAAGALIGVLLAPDKGSATRRKIVDKGGDLTDELKEKFTDLYEAMTEKINSLKGTAQDLAEEGKEYVKDGKGKMNEAKRGFESSKN